jgi:uncharacterized BrkB/YihY/UPF0761 family membrane protein
VLLLVLPFHTDVHRNRQTYLLWVFTMVMVLTQVLLVMFFGALHVSEAEAVTQHVLSYTLLKVLFCFCFCVFFLWFFF